MDLARKIITGQARSNIQNLKFFFLNDEKSGTHAIVREITEKNSMRFIFQLLLYGNLNS